MKNSTFSNSFQIYFERHPHPSLKVKILTPIIYIAYLTWHLFGRDGLQKRIPNIPFNLDISQLEYPGAAGDYWYSLYIASYFRDFELPPIDERWAFNIWPPGMSFWYTLLSWISPNNVILFHLILTGLLWASLISLPILMSKSWFRFGFLSILGFLLLSSDPFRNWFLGPGAFYSENTSILFFIAGILVFVRVIHIRKHEKTGILISGILFAISAYMRTVFDLAVLTGMACAIFLLILAERKYIGKNEKKIQTRKLKITISVLVIFLILTSPWRAYSIHNLNTPLMSGSSSGIWDNGWRTSDSLISSGNGIFIEYGLNSFCVAYQSKCQEIHQSQTPRSETELRTIAINSVIQNPLPWIKARFVTITSQFAKSIDWKSPNSFSLLILGLFYPLTTLMSVIGKRRRNLHNLTDDVFIISSMLITVLPLILASFEPRYFYPLLVTFYIAAMWKISKIFT